MIDPIEISLKCQLGHNIKYGVIGKIILTIFYLYY